MSLVFQNIDPPPPSPPGECVPLPPPPLVRGEDTLAGWRKGKGVNILEDARHSSELYICKYFVFLCLCSAWIIMNVVLSRSFCCGARALGHSL